MAAGGDSQANQSSGQQEEDICVALWGEVSLEGSFCLRRVFDAPVQRLDRGSISGWTELPRGSLGSLTIASRPLRSLRALERPRGERTHPARHSVARSWIKPRVGSSTSVRRTRRCYCDTSRYALRGYA